MARIKVHELRGKSKAYLFSQLKVLKAELALLRVAKVTGGAPNKLSKMRACHYMVARNGSTTSPDINIILPGNGCEGRSYKKIRMYQTCILIGDISNQDLKIRRNRGPVHIAHGKWVQSVLLHLFWSAIRKLFVVLADQILEFLDFTNDLSSRQTTTKNKNLKAEEDKISDAKGQDGKICIDCDNDTSPGTSEVLYKRLKVLILHVRIFSRFEAVRVNRFDVEDKLRKLEPMLLEAVDDQAVKVVDIVDTFRLQEQPPFHKKQFIAYIRKYIKLLTPKLDAEKEEFFKKNVEAATKYLLGKLSDLQFLKSATAAVECSGRWFYAL
ncbi:hypothetical protein CTI12_AA485970 [Artemisia annua]|uniref:TCTP domain-containing protein n=1 Tax=Artemisia annua TaxID=35608 RepID=A0A2U1LJ25_ARTAN|nr:hypothetical protein CTI12_AA485970 [Artemisia annua]